MGIFIIQVVMCELVRVGVLVGFCGGGGMLLFSVNEVDVEVFWLMLQSEYCFIEYLQFWVGFWFDEEKCLEVVWYFQWVRLEWICYSWLEDCVLCDVGFVVDVIVLVVVVEDFV